MKSVKPLYRLLTGVIEAFGAMKWVLFLTLLVIYACSIVFTSVVGKDMLDDGLPEDTYDFGTVAKSMFSLFRLMNGDTSAIHTISESLTGKVLFMVFMIISNWAILAILTSVVADNMIMASAKAEREEADIENEEKNHAREHEIKEIFKELDKDHSGTVSEEEWSILRNDCDLCKRLEAASGFGGTELDELFDCICDDVYNDGETPVNQTNSGDPAAGDPEAPGSIAVSAYSNASRCSTALVQYKTKRLNSCLESIPQRVLDYNTFAGYLRDQSNVARQCTVLHLKAKLRRAETKISTMTRKVGSLQERVERGFDELEQALILHVNGSPNFDSRSLSAINPGNSRTVSKATALSFNLPRIDDSEDG
jgi:hypothetical protein